MLSSADRSHVFVTVLSFVTRPPMLCLRWSAHAGWALCGHSAAPEADPADVIFESASQPEAAATAAIRASSGGDDRPAVANQDGSQHASLQTSQHSAVEDCSEEPPRRAGSSIPRAEKQAVGMMCKQLLDCGRLLWLRQHGFEVCRTS